MLHIILLILKIIGIIIVSIIGLLLLALLGCLFVPVVYRIKASKHSQDMQGFAGIYWLFISVKASMDNKDKEAKLKIRIFGIPLEVFQKIGGVIGKASKNMAKLFAKRKSIDKSAKQVAGTKTKKDSDSKLIKDEVVKVTEKVSPEKASEDKTNGGETSAEKDDSKEGLWDRIKTILIKIYYFPQWLFEKVRKIYLTISELYGKIKKWKEFLTEETFKRALRFVMDKGNTLRKHALPRKITGNITYGFDDPSHTGQVLAVLSVITPLYKGKFDVIPMFNQKILEGDICMKGRVFGFALVRIAWSVYRNKDVKEVIHHFSQKEA